MEAPLLLTEFNDAADTYALTGRATFNGDHFQDRRLHQCPTVFGLPSLSGRPFWSVQDLGRDIDADVVRAISMEYWKFHHVLRRESISQDVPEGHWDAAYLMTEGRWEFLPSSSVVREMFPLTASVLASLDVFETSLGYVYFSRLTKGTVIRPHCGVTNCKLRVQIVLYEEAELVTDAVTEALLGGHLTVDGESRAYAAGDVIVFDDSYVHGVDLRESQRDRVVLLVDVWHPLLTGAEQETVRHGIEGVFPPQGDAGGEAVFVTAVATVNSEAMATVATMMEHEGAIIPTSNGEGADQVGVGEARLVSAVAPMTAAVAVAEAVAGVEVEVVPDGAKSLNATKLANDVLDRQFASRVAAAALDSTAVVRADEVFTSPPGGEEYKGNPNTTQYGKGSPQLWGNDPQHHFLLKLLMVGDTSVGKTSFLLRLAEDYFSPHYLATIGVDFKMLRRSFCDPVLPWSVLEAPAEIKLQIWDTAGPERFRTITSSYYRGSAGFFVFFDVSVRESFENVPLWMNEIARFGAPDSASILIGMKGDIAWPEDAAAAGVSAASASSEKIAAMAVPAEEAPGHRVFAPPSVLMSGSHHSWHQGPPPHRVVSYEEGSAMAQRFDLPYIECSAKDAVHIEDALATLVHHIMRRREALQSGAPIDTTRGLRAGGAAPGVPPGGPTIRRCVVS